MLKEIKYTNDEMCSFYSNTEWKCIIGSVVAIILYIFSKAKDLHFGLSDKLLSLVKCQYT